MIDPELTDHIKSHSAFTYGLFYWIYYDKSIEIVNNHLLLIDDSVLQIIDRNFRENVIYPLIRKENLRRSTH